jgi:hypothetical protein
MGIVYDDGVWMVYENVFQCKNTERLSDIIARAFRTVAALLTSGQAVASIWT